MTRIIIFILMAVTTGAAGDGGYPPQWPLDLETRYLTGNFMEPRGGRFHTGLDIKTNSRAGYAVLAARDGWISRVKFAPGGYGKAIYLRADDGLIYVYGHLGRLADGLREHVRALQKRRGAYAMDLTFAAGEWPVARGEVLALSGQSGTTGPHLHFEVRAADGSPLDPLAHGFAVADTMAPEILAVRAVATGAAEELPTLRWGTGKAPLTGRIPDLFLAHGNLRFTARIVERSDHLRYRLGAWQVRLFVDDREVFGSRNEQLHWRRNRQQRLEYLRTPLGQERWLWRDSRVSLDGRAPASGFGDGPLPAGRHHLRLVAEDRSGNRSEVAWVVEVDPGLPADGHPGWEVTTFTYPGPWRVDSSGPEPAGGECADVSPAVHWRRGRPERVPSARWMQLAGLETVADPIHFRTPGTVVLDAVDLTWPATDASPPPAGGDDQVGVYQLRSGQWKYATVLRAGAVFAFTGPGVYGVLRDVAAPVIATAPVETALERQSERRQHGIAMPRWPVIRIPVGDAGSGVDWSTLTVQLDDQPLVVEPDPPRQRILVELPDDLPAGRHALAIRVADRAGHWQQAMLPVTLRNPAGP